MGQKSDLGNANQVVADLQKKVDEANEASGENPTPDVPTPDAGAPAPDAPAPAEKPAEAKKTVVKVSDLIYEAIQKSTLLSDEVKTKLLAEIKEKVDGATTGKSTIKNEIKAILMEATKTAIHQDDVYDKVQALHPEIKPFQLSKQIYGILQPFNFKASGWDVTVTTVKDGLTYKWNPKK